MEFYIKSFKTYNNLFFVIDAQPPIRVNGLIKASPNRLINWEEIENTCLSTDELIKLNFNHIV